MNNDLQITENSGIMSDNTCKHVGTSRIIYCCQLNDIDASDLLHFMQTHSTIIIDIRKEIAGLDMRPVFLSHQYGQRYIRANFFHTDHIQHEKKFEMLQECINFRKYDPCLIDDGTSHDLMQYFAQSIQHIILPIACIHQIRGGKDTCTG